LLVLILTVGGYVAYVAANYYRIEDNQSLSAEGGANSKVQKNNEYTLLSYNVGFGAYSPEYTFFMDEGEMKDGTKTVGKYGKGISYADVNKNVEGQASVLSAQSADFMFLQEVDEDADRSYHINMLEKFKQTFPAYGAVFANNFHTPYLMYPFNDPIGSSQAGILTLTKYKAESAVRHSFPLSGSFFSDVFDLDRCFSATYLPVDGTSSYLVLVNLHMSAYDEGGTVRAKQLETLNTFLKSERDKGNYVVAGGDFNHCLIADQFDSDEEALNYFASNQVTPDWVKNSVLHNAELTEGFTIAASTNYSTCRGADMVYEEGVTYSTVIDGFIVSDNVTVNYEGTINTNYAYSDHNPVKIKFELN
jgi:endonuclease/exonuclease/phosphatase family metal-dependent hydrolase